MNQDALTPMNGENIDPDTFRRVWERVMPDQQHSPIVVTGENRLPPVLNCTAESGQDTQLSPVPNCAAEPGQDTQLSPVPNCAAEPGQDTQLPPVPNCVTQPEQKPELPPVPGCPVGDTGLTMPEGASCPCREREACLGDDSADEARCLEERIAMAQMGARMARAIARRAGGAVARVMGTVAADHRLAVRRLSTAYFLITGCRFVPESGEPALPSSLALALREQFRWEQRWEYCNRASAQDVSDPCLTELYEELAQEGALHAGSIRSLLEQMT